MQHSKRSVRGFVVQKPNIVPLAQAFLIASSIMNLDEMPLLSSAGISDAGVTWMFGRNEVCHLGIVSTGIEPQAENRERCRDADGEAARDIGATAWIAGCDWPTSTAVLDAE